MRFAVDTNILVVANGRNTNASPSCRLAVVDFLAEMMKRGRLIIDLEGLVEDEYRRNIDLGQPGVGNLFFQYFIATASERLERVSLGRDKHGEFVAFLCTGDLRRFDRSDRKFGALSKTASCSVANATDSDWLDMRAALERDGVQVHFVCGCDRRTWVT